MGTFFIILLFGLTVWGFLWLIKSDPIELDAELLEDSEDMSTEVPPYATKIVETNPSKIIPEANTPPKKIRKKRAQNIK